MDQVHIYVTSRSQIDNDILGGLQNSFNGFGFLQQLDHTSYDLQLAAYAVAWNETHDTLVERTGILWLKASTRGEGKGESIQGKGWQLKQYGNIMSNFLMFKNYIEFFLIIYGFLQFYKFIIIYVFWHFVQISVLYYIPIFYYF
jgi:hypothetical protein